MNLSQKYALETTDEEFLNLLNDELKGQHEIGLTEGLPEQFASLHVVGVPRSGTTLLTQLIASELNVGYINNLAAAFWRAPVYGIRLAKKLLPSHYQSNFRSEFGRTDNILEPHEFGRFWIDLLQHTDMSEPDKRHEEKIDWSHVYTMMTNMAATNGGPMVFKSFLATWYMSRFVEVLKKSFFIWVERDPLENALSLLHTRRQYANSESHWVGLKPSECSQMDAKSVHFQVASQVHYLHQAIETRLAMVPRENWIKIPYEDLCNDPTAAVSRIATAARQLDSSISLPAKQLKSRTVSCPSKRMPADDVEQVQAAFNTLTTNG